MKKKLAIFVLLFFFSLVAKSQFDWGVRVMVPVNIEKFDFKNPSFDDFTFQTKQYFYAGINAEAMIPVLGLGIEGSALLTMSSVSIQEVEKSYKQGYLSLPINLKYRLCLPGMEKILSAFISVGPYFDLKIIGSDIEFKDIDSGFNNIVFESKPFNWGMNYSVGFKFFKTLQLGLGYMHNVSHPFDFNEILVQSSGLNKDIGKYKGWFVSATLMF